MSGSRSRSRSTLVVAVVGTIAISTACSSSTGKSDPAKQAAKPVAKQAVAIGKAVDSQGPDPAVPGAKAGGTVTVLQHSDFSHLDPARVWSSTNQTGDLLLTRQLTSYQQVGGTTKLVGD